MRILTNFGIHGFFVAFSAAVLLSGCADVPADQPDLNPVTGTVTLDGNPLAGAAIVFESANGQVAFGQTDENGHYEMVYKGPWKGAVTGQNTVRITTASDAPPDPGWREPIHPLYNRRTTLTAEVVSGENTFDFALESKPSKR